MSYIDKNLVVSDSQDLTGATQYSTYSVDLGVSKLLTYGKQLYLVSIIDVLFTSTNTTATLQINVVTSANADLTSHEMQQQTGFFNLADSDLTANREKIVMPIANALGIKGRYLGVQYEVGTEVFTAGNITTYFTFDP